MKKFLSVVLCLMIMCLACTAFAVEKQPGDSVTITISVSGNGEKAVTTRVKVSGDTSVFAFEGAAVGGGVAGAAPTKLNANFNVKSADLASPLSGTLGTMTLRIKDDAKPGTYTISVTTSSTYDTNGNKVSISVSGSTTVVIPEPKCDHTFGEWSVTTPADCENAGEETRECSLCGEKETRELAAAGHAYDDGVPTKEATCKEEGVMTFTCATCGHTYTEAIAKSDKHSWDEGVVDTPAGCLTDGVKVFTCSVCGLTDEAIIEAPGEHTYNEADLKTEVEPTCTENGKGSFTCTACGEKIDGGVIPALGHDEIVKTTEATCGKDGKTVTTCSRCDYEKTDVLPATGLHTTSESVITAPTCGAKGEKKITCANCDYTKTEEIPATGEHTYGEEITTKPGCETKGEKTFTCSVCGDSYTEEIAATGHTEGSDLKEQAPTCQKPGYKYYTCTVCKAEVKDSDIGKVDHEYEVTEEVPATCTENGKRVYACIYECGKTKTETLKKLGHNMGEWEPTTPATCTENGEETRVCLNGCGKTETRVVKAAHSWGEWVIDKEAGTKTHVCTACGVEETKALANHYIMTVCSYGIRFRDLDNPITKDWYMFTPIDLSVEGEQTIDLIAGNMHKIGTATVLVKEGTVTVTTKVSNPYNIVYEEEFLTFVPALSELTELDFDAMTNYAYGEAISIEEALGGDTKVLLLMRNNAWYADNSRGVESFNGKGKEYNAYVEELELLMD